MKLKFQKKYKQKISQLEVLLFLRGKSGLNSFIFLKKKINIKAVVLVSSDIEVVEKFKKTYYDYKIIIWNNSDKIYRLIKVKNIPDFIISINFAYILNEKILNLPKYAA